MKTLLYLNGEKMSRKKLNALLGVAVVRELVLITKERNFINKSIGETYCIGKLGVITVLLV